MSAIDISRIDAMVSQLRTAAASAQGKVSPLQGELSATKTDFSSVLKTSLDQVNNAQVKAEQMGQKFVVGDDSVNLSDVMISIQKANISFQATVQARNKLVTAYHDIMGMSV